MEVWIARLYVSDEPEGRIRAFSTLAKAERFLEREVARFYKQYGTEDDWTLQPSAIRVVVDEEEL